MPDLSQIMNMDNAQLLAFVFTVATGFFMPLVVSAVLRASWGFTAKMLTSIGVSVAVGAGMAYFGHQFDNVTTAAGFVAVLFLSSTVAYEKYWKGTPWEQWLRDSFPAALWGGGGQA